VQLNIGSFGDTQVSVRKVLWDRYEDWSEKASFDIAVAADVVYLEQFHTALLGMIARVVKPGGQFLLFASRRNGSLDKFVSTAKGFFPSVDVSTDYDDDVSRAIGRHAKCFPVFVRLTSANGTEELPKSVALLCEELRERRALQLRQQEAEEEARKREQSRREARSLALLEKRQRRLEAFDAEAEERAAQEAAAAEAAVAAAVKPRAPIVPLAEQEGRSDWGLFSRKCSLSCDNACKDMAYDMAGCTVSIRRPLERGGGFLYGEVAKKLSPSEEALAMWATKNRCKLKRKRVLELGAGTGLAGLATAVCTGAKHVELTDGDPTVLAMLEDNLALNRGACSARRVNVQRLLWGEEPSGMKPFDWILAADVLDGDQTALLKTLRRLLKPSGTAVLFAPPRGGTLNTFLSSASSAFDRVEVVREYDEDVTRALHGMSCCPRMLRLQQSATCAPRASTVAQVVKAAPRHKSEPVVPPIGQAAPDDGEGFSRKQPSQGGDPEALVEAVAEVVAEADEEAEAKSCRRSRRNQVLADRWRRKAAARSAAAALAAAATTGNEQAESDDETREGIESRATAIASASTALRVAAHIDIGGGTSGSAATMTPVEVSPQRLPSLSCSRTSSNSSFVIAAVAEAPSSMPTGRRRSDEACGTDEGQKGVGAGAAFSWRHNASSSPMAGALASEALASLSHGISGQALEVATTPAARSACGGPLVCRAGQRRSTSQPARMASQAPVVVPELSVDAGKVGALALVSPPLPGRVASAWTSSVPPRRGGVVVAKSITPRTKSRHLRCGGRGPPRPPVACA